MSKRKIFVLDTCVLLYDHTSYRAFGNNDVVIPHQVLEELDNFKKGNEAINYEARQIIRVIDALSEKGSLDDWTPIGENGTGRIKVAYNKRTLQLNAIEIFNEDKPDHRILNTALYLNETEDADVWMISKDVNLRVKAKSLGLQTEDYITGIPKNVHHEYTGKYILTNASGDAIDKLYAEGEIELTAFADAEGYPSEDDIITNTYFVIKNGKKSVLAFYEPTSKKLVVVEKNKVMNITPRNSEQIFAIHAVLESDARIISVVGKAGTGKTLITLAAALEQRDDYQQIYIARPIVPLNNKDIGYLPGDVDSKIAPYMDPIWDNLKFIKTQSYLLKKGQQKIDDNTLKEKIVVTPLTFIRGRSLSDVLFIVDEAQNLSPIEVKTIITRIGENSKIIFTGDIEQIDNPFLSQQSNGLSYMIEKLRGEKLYAHIVLEKGERSEVATLAATKL